MGWSIWDKHSKIDLHRKIMVPVTDKIIARRRILLALHINVDTCSSILKAVQFGVITSLSCVSGARKQCWSNRLTNDLTYLNGSENPDVTYEKLLRVFTSSRSTAKSILNSFKCQAHARHLQTSEHVNHTSFEFFCTNDIQK